MDFWYSFEIHREKLPNSSNITDLLDEHGKIQVDCEFFNEFQKHLFVAPEDFWQSAVNNILDHRRDENTELNDSLITYIISLVSWYTDEELSNPDSTRNCGNSSLLASQFYFRLLNYVEFKYFKGVIYENSFNCLGKYYEGHQRNHNCLKFLESLRRFLIKNELSRKYLQVTLFQLCEIIEKTSNKVYTDFSVEYALDFTHEALLCVKSIAVQTWPIKVQFIINYALLHGIRIESGSETMKKNFRNLIIDLKNILMRENYSCFQNVFLYILTKSKSFDSQEACKIMLVLDENFFKDTIFKITTISTAKEVPNKSNILRLLANLLDRLPTNYYEPSKLEVFIQTVFNILVMNCINNDEAISLVSKICLLSKDVINKQFKVLLNTPTEYIYVENSLPIFCMKFNIHWSNRARNKNIAIIILRIMSITYSSTLDEQYAGILAMIANEADSSDLRICIPILLKLYVTSNSQNSEYVANKTLEVIYSMAVHRSSGSSEFVKLIFQLILEPKEEIQQFKQSIITSLSTQILADNKIFIDKAYELKLCDDENIKKLINMVLSADYVVLRITCAVVEKSPSRLGEKLVYHVMSNPALLSEVKYAKDLLFIINSGLKYFIAYPKKNILSPEQLNILGNFSKLLLENISKFILSFNALGVGLDVLKSLADLRKENLDFKALYENVNFELKATLSKLPDAAFTIPMMYSAELLCEKEYDVPEETIKLLMDVIDKTRSKSDQQENTGNSSLHARHYFSLVLLVRLSMKHSKLGPKAMNCLKDAMKTTDHEFKMSIMDLMYDLCTYVVHNIEEFLHYSFNDLKSMNLASRKQAATHIEHFVRLDYLKLSVEQYCKFISLIGDPTIEKTMENLMTNFIMSNQGVIEKYFLPLIMHVNFYAVHPMCPMNPQYMQDMNCIIRANFNKWKVYSTLFRSLPLRSKFLILKDVCTSFFAKFTLGEIKIEDGVWNVMNDAISLFKIMAYNSLDNVSYEDFYEKEIVEITKYLIDKKSFSTDVPLKCPEMKDTIEKVTYSLLHLLFYTENESILQNYKLKLFEAILFWTHDLLPDIAAVCNSRKENTPLKISNYYSKLVRFYKNHKQCLNITEYISEYNESNTFTSS